MRKVEIIFQRSCEIPVQGQDEQEAADVTVCVIIIIIIIIYEKI